MAFLVHSIVAFTGFRWWFSLGASRFVTRPATHRSGQEVLKYHGLGRVGSGQEVVLLSRVGSGCPYPTRLDLTREGLT